MSFLNLPRTLLVEHDYLRRFTEQALGRGFFTGSGSGEGLDKFCMGTLKVLEWPSDWCLTAITGIFFENLNLWPICFVFENMIQQLLRGALS